MNQKKFCFYTLNRILGFKGGKSCIFFLPYFLPIFARVSQTLVKELKGKNSWHANQLQEGCLGSAETSSQGHAMRCQL